MKQKDKNRISIEPTSNVEWYPKKWKGKEPTKKNKKKSVFKK